MTPERMKELLGHEPLKPTVLPWRYIVPRRGYFKQAKASRKYPFVPAYLDRAALCAVLGTATMAVGVMLLILRLPMELMYMVVPYSERRQAMLNKVDALIFKKPFAKLVSWLDRLPDFYTLRDDHLEEARFIHRAVRDEQGR